MDQNKRACVLLSTYNGERYLEEQLESLLRQEGTALKIIIRDDGSTDDTVAIIRRYAESKPEQIEMLESDGNVGVARSFITLLRYAVGQGYDYYFFSDQDDCWKADKCRRAIERLRDARGDALYFTKKAIVDARLNPMGVEDRIAFSGTFWDCFTFSNISGCTMCFNKDLAEKLIRNDFVGKKYIHDAFLYRLAIVLNAELVYDDYESILYRQHGKNVVGSVNGGSIKRVLDKKAAKKRKHYMRELFRDILRLYEDIIPEENRDIVELVAGYDTDWRKTLKLAATVVQGGCTGKQKAKLVGKMLLHIL